MKVYVEDGPAVKVYVEDGPAFGVLVTWDHQWWRGIRLGLAKWDVLIEWRPREARRRWRAIEKAVDRAAKRTAGDIKAMAGDEDRANAERLWA